MGRSAEVSSSRSSARSCLPSRFRHGRGDVARNVLDVAQVHRAVRLRRRRHRDENHVGFLDALGGAVGEFKPPGGDIFLYEIFESGFVNRDAAGLEQFDFRRVVVHANDMVADLGKTGSRDQTDVARSDNRQLHVYSFDFTGAAGVVAGVAAGNLFLNSIRRIARFGTERGAGIRRSQRPDKGRRRR